MREKLRKYGSDILYYSLSFIATLIVWLAHDLDRIGVLKEVDFALELMWWLILMLFAWAGELLPVEEPDYGPEINRRNQARCSCGGCSDSRKAGTPCKRKPMEISVGTWYTEGKRGKQGEEHER